MCKTDAVQFYHGLAFHANHVGLCATTTATELPSAEQVEYEHVAAFELLTNVYINYICVF